MGNDKSKTLLYNIFIFAIGNVLVKLISFFLMPLYTSQMTTEQYGVAELLNNLIEIVLPVVTLCIIDAVYRFTIDEDADFAIVFSNAVRILLIGYAAVIISGLIIYFFTGYTYVLYFVLLYIAATAGKLCAQFARGLGHVKRFIAGGIINALTLVGANLILLVYFNGGVEAYILSLIISYLIAGIYNFLASGEYRYIDFSKNGAKSRKEMLRFSVPNILNTLSWWVNNISNRYIILWFIGASAAGMFTAASKLPAIINVFTTIFQQAWQYSTSKEIGGNDSDIFFSQTFRYFNAFTTLLCSGIILVTPVISIFILRGDFYEAWRYVPMLLLSATIGCTTTFFGSFYTAVKESRRAMLTTLAGASVNIILNFSLVRVIGIYSALTANIVSMSVIAAIRIIDTKKFAAVSANWTIIIIQYIILFAQSILWLFKTPYTAYAQIFLFIIITLFNMRYILDMLKKAVSVLPKHGKAV